MKKLLLTIGILITSIPVFSHVALDYPAGGEEFHPGQSVTIVWHILIQHNTQNWDLYFSNDGGETWQEVQENIPVETLSYDWTVPDDLTDQGRIKVVQDNVVANYEDESFDFTITASSGIITRPNEIPIDVYPNPADDYIRIKSKDRKEIEEMHILGFDGRVMEIVDLAGQALEKDNAHISLRGYVPGTYFLVVIGEGKRSTATIVKH